MNRTTKLIYWAATILLAVQLIGTGVGDVMLADQIVENIVHVGFPVSLIPFLGVLKIAGGLTLLFVKDVHLRVAAYAGVVFYGLGAMYAHVGINDPIATAIPALLMVIVTLASYFLWKRSLPTVSTKS